MAGGKINRPGQLAPGGEDNQGGGQDIPGQLGPQGGKLSRGWGGGQDKLLQEGVNTTTIKIVAMGIFFLAHNIGISDVSKIWITLSPTFAHVR